MREFTISAVGKCWHGVQDAVSCALVAAETVLPVYQRPHTPHRSCEGFIALKWIFLAANFKPIEC